MPEGVVIETESYSAARRHLGRQGSEGAGIMIRAVEIKGLRGIREGKLADLTPLVVLVGPNGSGKSTVLDALMIGANPQLPEAIGPVVQRRQDQSPGARWLLRKAGREGPAEIAIITDTGTIRNCALSVVSSSQDHTRINGTVTDRDPRGERDVTSFIADFQATHFAASNSVHALPGVPEVRFLDPDATNLRVPLHQLYTRIVEQGQQERAKELMKSLVPGVEDVQILAAGNTPVLYLVFRDYAVPAALAGDGIRLLLHLSFELAVRQGGLVLMEEPEVHMHPGAIRQCAQAIIEAVRRGVQVTLTTHSLELIDALVAASSDEDLKKLSVYGLKLQEGVLKSSRLAGPEVAFARTEIEDDLR
jgi:energy-coupling factor transporter ATP-binding protein EcfA2